MIRARPGAGERPDDLDQVGVGAAVHGSVVEDRVDHVVGQDREQDLAR